MRTLKFFLLLSVLCLLTTPAFSQNSNGYSPGSSSSSGSSGPVTLSGDVTGASNANEVVGILSHALPSLSLGYLNWNGSAWVFTAGSAIFTPGADLSGNGTSTATNQYVSSLSFSSSAAGGTIPINGTSTTLQFAANNVAPALTVATQTTDVTPPNLLIQGGAPWPSAVTNKAAGSIVLNNPLPVSGGASSNVIYEYGGAAIASLGVFSASNPTYGALSLGSATNQVLYSPGTDTTLNAASGHTVQLDINGVPQLTMSNTVFTVVPPTWAWSASAAAPAIQQSNPSTDVAPSAMTVVAQGAEAAASTNRVGGNLVLKGGTGAITNGTGGSVQAALNAPTGTGSEATFSVLRGAVTEAQLAALTGNSTVGALMLGGVANSTTTYTMFGDGTNTVVNAMTGGGVYARVNNTTIAQFISTGVLLSQPAVEWLNGVTAPNLTHQALASTSAGSGAAGQPMSFTAQAGQAATGASNNGGAGGALTLSSGAGGTSGSATKGAPGAINLNVTGTSGTDQATINFQNGGTSFLTLIESSSGATSQFTLPAALTNLVFNASNGSQTTQFSGPSGGLTIGPTAGFSVPVAGLGTTPLSFKGQTSPNTVACGTGGTQTISAAQSIIPFFLVTTGTLSSNCILDFGTNEVTGHSILDFSGAGSLGAFSIQIKNGTATQNITASTLPANAVTVYTHGANGLSVVGIPASSGGSAPTLHSQTFTSSGTFTPPAGVSVVNVTGYGGGGAGGGSGSTTVSGSGGGAAIQSTYMGLAVTPSVGITVTIGAGGAAVASNAGQAGADTTFGALATFSGASGGIDSSAAIPGGGQPFKLTGGGNAYTTTALVSGFSVPSTFLAAGGAGANASQAPAAGYRNLIGGFDGGAAGTTVTFGGGGGGGAGPGGVGGNGGNGSANGSNGAANTGAGGGGGGATSGTTTGGNGGSGSLTVTWIG